MSPLRSAGRSKPTPWLSVVMPVYNGAEYVTQALESVARESVGTQRAGDLEVIVVDDGSGDATPDIVARYAERLRLTLVRREHGGSWTASTNLGLRMAAGRYACILHQDDYWLPGRLRCLRRRCMRRARARKRPCSPSTPRCTSIGVEGGSDRGDAPFRLAPRGWPRPRCSSGSWCRTSSPCPPPSSAAGRPWPWAGSTNASGTRPTGTSGSRWPPPAPPSIARAPWRASGSTPNRRPSAEAARATASARTRRCSRPALAPRPIPRLAYFAVCRTRRPILDRRQHCAGRPLSRRPRAARIARLAVATIGTADFLPLPPRLAHRRSRRRPAAIQSRCISLRPIGAGPRPESS